MPTATWSFPCSQAFALIPPSLALFSLASCCRVFVVVVVVVLLLLFLVVVFVFVFCFCLVGVFFVLFLFVEGGG